MFVFLFILSIILTAGSFGMIGLFIYGTTFPEVFGMLFIFLISFVGVIALGCVAHFLQTKLKAETSNKAMKVILTVFLILTIIQYGIGYFFIFLFIEGRKHEWKSTETVKVKDENGKEHTLTQSYTGSSTYKDENGDWWETKDGGNTFSR